VIVELECREDRPTHNPTAIKFLSCAIIYKDYFIVAYLKHTIMMSLAHFKFNWNDIKMCF